MDWRIIRVVGCLFFGCVFTCTGADQMLFRDFWSADSIQWGDGRPYETPVKKEGPYPQGFRADYTFVIPASGWYELLFPNTAVGLRHDLLIDGVVKWRYRATSRVSSGGDKLVKAGNLWLESGKHLVRVQRVGYPSFPPAIIGGIELRVAQGRPEASITAEKTFLDMMRVGEALEITVTAGGLNSDITFEILRFDLIDPSRKPIVVAEVAVKKDGAPLPRKVRIECSTEGAFDLKARIKGGKDFLLGCEFPIEGYGVVDVRQFTAGNGRLEIVHDIDCAAGTDRGIPLKADAFRECNGPTRVQASAAGTFRESHNSTVPGADPMKTLDDWNSFSGFSYKLEIPEVQIPYLIDIEFPDDARRSVTIGQNWISESGELVKGTYYSAKAYETGGFQPLTYETKHHRAIVWAASNRMVLTILSQQFPHRAAISKIKISRFVDGMVPVSPKGSGRGRTFYHWYEEANNWRYLVNIGGLYPEGLAHDFVGLDRWLRLARYFGANGVSACGVSYQLASWRATTLDGFGPKTYDECRLAALLCEKYGMKYMPEVFPTQWYMNMVMLPERTGKPEDLSSYSYEGKRSGPEFCPNDMNALHPLVQEKWMKALGELADKLRDCSSFQGITIRADEWLSRGEFMLPSLNWGYGDWIVKQFETEIGIEVPVAEKDLERFSKRFSFLTSSAMRERWEDWRCARIMSYHKNLRQRIQGGRPELFFGIVGDFRSDPGPLLSSSINERARGCGVNLVKMGHERSLIAIPYGRYGFRNLGYEARACYDEFFDPENLKAGMGALRSFSAYMNYLEFGHEWPAEKLGLPGKPREAPYYYCSTALASGRGSLEKFAVALAEQDSALLRDGGNSDIYGDSEIWRPWFAGFESLPALKFQSFPIATDSIAVWYRLCDRAEADVDGLYFYAVNREPFSVKIILEIRGVNNVTRLGAGNIEALSNGVLELTLQPFELRAWRASRNAVIFSAKTRIPQERINYIEKRIEFAQRIADKLKNTYQDEVSLSKKKDFLSLLEIAKTNYKQGKYWRARTALSMAPALEMYEAFGVLPAGQVYTEFPDEVVDLPWRGQTQQRHLTLSAESLVAESSGGVLKSSTEFNQDWSGAKVLWTDSGKLEMTVKTPASGRYALRLGFVAQKKGEITCRINGVQLERMGEGDQLSMPQTVAFRSVSLKQGINHIEIGRSAPFGVYAVQLVRR